MSNASIPADIKKQPNLSLLLSAGLAEARFYPLLGPTLLSQMRLIKAAGGLGGMNSNSGVFGHLSDSIFPREASGERLRFQRTKSTAFSRALPCRYGNTIQQ